MRTRKRDMPAWKRWQEEALQALNDEVNWMNEQLSLGKLASFATSESFIDRAGSLVTRRTTYFLTRVESVNHGLMMVWLRVRPELEEELNLDLCFLGNDERWATMLPQVGIPRHPFFLRELREEEQWRGERKRAALHAPSRE